MGRRHPLNECCQSHIQSPRYGDPWLKGLMGADIIRRDKRPFSCLNKGTRFLKFVHTDGRVTVQRLCSRHIAPYINGYLKMFGAEAVEIFADEYQAIVETKHRGDQEQSAVLSQGATG